MSERFNGNFILMICLASSVILLDQISKAVVVGKLRLFESIEVINGFFNLVHVRNRGMAFGFLNKPGMDYSIYFLITASFAAIIVLLVWFYMLEEYDRKVTIGISLIIGGAAGNLIDRIRLREVIDFLDFYLVKYHWPAFNVADSAITAGAFLIGFSMLFPSRDSG